MVETSFAEPDVLPWPNQPMAQTTPLQNADDEAPEAGIPAALM